MVLLHPCATFLGLEVQRARGPAFAARSTGMFAASNGTGSAQETSAVDAVAFHHAEAAACGTVAAHAMAPLLGTGMGTAALAAQARMPGAAPALAAQTARATSPVAGHVAAPHPARAVAQLANTSNAGHLPGTTGAGPGLANSHLYL